MKPSIGRRLLLVGTLLVAVFAGLAGWSLDSAFRRASEAALAERLQAAVYTLLATAREDEHGRLRMPDDLPDPQFNRPDAGRYARIVGLQDGYRWHSRSLLGRELPASPALATGRTRLYRSDGLMLLDQAIAWDDLQGRPLPYLITVASDTRALQAQQQQFRATLWGWLGLLSLLLLGLQLAALRWGLSPLYRIAEAIKRVEQGDARALPRQVPVELEPLTRNLDALLRQAQARQERVRNSLADLAHSLKTPLTLLRGAAEEARDCPELARLVEEQVSRIDEIVGYQRQRAAVSGGTVLSPPVPLRPLAERIGRGLARLHAARGVRLELDLPEELAPKIDQGDLLELLGNLLENAFRHARSRVRLSGSASPPRLVVEDDGEGIPPDQAQRILQRGGRADRRHPGEGIGLAVVAEILAQYGGEIAIDASPLGGARFTLALGDPLKP